MTGFRRHMIEMALSMIIPMALLAVGFYLVLPALGVNVRPGPGSPAGIAALVVALLGMTVPMVVFMRVRGHSWRQAAEMTAAMFIPLLLIMPVTRLLLPSLGLEPAPALLMPLAFTAMTGGMMILMLVQREAYAAHADKAHT